jgi:hypothetical protein
MTALLLAAQLATTAPACLTVQPSPAFVCVEGGWLPPGHPRIPVQDDTTRAPVRVEGPPLTPYDATDPRQNPYLPRFRVGHRYQRGTSDIHIAGTGQLPDGAAVLFAVCLAEGDSCYGVGYVRMFPYNVNATDWIEVTR